MTDRHLMTQQTNLEYGVVANVVETDRVMRTGAKVWISMSNPGSGDERVVVYGLSRGGRNVRKWIPLWRLDNFRRAWIPDHLRDHVWKRGSKRDMASYAGVLGDLSVQYRNEHPARHFKGNNPYDKDGPMTLQEACAALGGSSRQVGRAFMTETPLGNALDWIKRN